MKANKRLVTIGKMVGVGAIMLSNQALGAAFSFGSINGNFDSRINYGLSVRVGNPEGVVPATDGGDRNFKSGDIVVNRLTGIHSLDLNSGPWSMLVRGSYYYDGANDSADLAVGNLVDADVSDRRAIDDATLLDAFLAFSGAKVGSPISVRLGRQVISWGEGLFIGGGINTINTSDVTKLRTPGVDIKEALLPNESVYGLLSITPNLQLEAFLLLDFDEIKLDPAGTFFNTSTFIADGGVRLGPLTRRRSDDYARNSGQRGVALRYLAAELGAGVEFAAYYTKLHDSAPKLATKLGSRQYFLTYPEDTELFGVSFNTVVGGPAWTGEYSYRRNAPVSVGGGPAIVGAANGAPTVLPTDGNVALGYDRAKMHLVLTGLQTTVQAHIIGADTGSIIGEVGYVRFDDLPALYTADESAWGYQIRMSADYNGALFHRINLTPTLSFSHGVRGSAGPFTDEAKTISVGVNWSYLLGLSGSISYTSNFDGPQTRADRDRNWASVNVSYEF